VKRALLCAFAGAVMIVLFCGSACAEEGIAAELYGEELEQFSAVLPDELPPELRGALRAPDGVETAADALDFSAVWARIAAEIRDAWPSAAALMLRLMGLLMISALFGGCGKALGGSSLTPACELCSTLCTALAAAEPLGAMLNSCRGYLETMTELVNGVTPIACALCAASGQLNTAAVSRAALMLLYTLYQNLYTVLLLPAVRIEFCFGIIGSIGAGVRLDALSRGVRRVFTWLLAMLGLVLTFTIGVQNVIAKSTDSFTMRTVKFALGSFIPLVGGALSDALGTAAGSLSLIRTACGAVCMAAVLILAVPLIVQLVLNRTVLALCRGAAEMIGCEREGRLIGEMHGVVGTLLAAAAMVSLLFLLILALLIGMRSTGG